MEWLLIGLVCVVLWHLWSRKKTQAAHELWMAQLEYRIQEVASSVNRNGAENTKILEKCLKSLEAIQHYEKALVDLAYEEKNKKRQLEDREFDQYRQELNPDPQWLPKANIRE
jgi:hypothetical protein